jgi:hypothetical protein
MREQTAVKTQQSDSPAATGLLQRKCACGQHTTDQHGQCTECNKKGQLLQRRTVNQSGPEIAPPTVHEGLRPPGRPLDAATRTDMEPRFGHDFSRIPAHTGGPTQIQAKLTINKPGDKYEQEADRVAEQVISMPMAVQRQPVPGGKEEDERLQLKPLAVQITPMVQREAIDEEDENKKDAADHKNSKALSLSPRGKTVEEEEKPANDSVPSDRPYARVYGPVEAGKVPRPRWSPSREWVKAEREAAKWWRLWREWKEYEENRPRSNLGIIEDRVQKAGKAIKESGIKHLVPTVRMLLEAIEEKARYEKEKAAHENNPLQGDLNKQDKRRKKGEKPQLPKKDEEPQLPKKGEKPQLPKKDEEPQLPKKGEKPQLPKKDEEPEKLRRQPLNQEKLLATKGADAEVPTVTSSVEAAVQSVRQNGGQPLDAATRAIMESRFGHDFSHVRVHTGPQAAAAAQAVSARAFTIGSDVVSGQGQHAPGTVEGQRLLAHELTHVVQQSATSTQVSTKLQRTPVPAASMASVSSRSSPNAPPSSTCNALDCKCDQDMVDQIRIGQGKAINAMTDTIIAADPDQRTKLRTRRKFKNIFGAAGDVDAGLKTVRENLKVARSFLHSLRPNQGIFCDPDPQRCVGAAYHEPRKEELPGTSTTPRIEDRSIIAICTGREDERKHLSGEGIMAGHLIHESMHHVIQPAIIDIYQQMELFGFISGRSTRFQGVALKNPDSYVKFVEAVNKTFAVDRDTSVAYKDTQELSVRVLIGRRVFRIAYRIAQKILTEPDKALYPPTQEHHLSWAEYPDSTQEIIRLLIGRGQLDVLEAPDLPLSAEDQYNYFVNRMGIIEDLRSELKSVYEQTRLRGAVIRKTPGKAPEEDGETPPIEIRIGDPKSFRDAPLEEQVELILEAIIPQLSTTTVPNLPEIVTSFSKEHGILSGGGSS